LWVFFPASVVTVITSAIPALWISELWLSTFAMSIEGVTCDGNFSARLSDVSATDISTGTAYASLLIRTPGGGQAFDMTSFDIIPNAGFSASTRVGFGFINTANTSRNDSFVLFTGTNRSYSTTSFSGNTIYHVIIEYQFVAGSNNDVVNLYVSPTTMSLGALPAALISVTTSAGDPLTDVGGISVADDGALEIDGIRITDGGVPLPVGVGNLYGRLVFLWL
jgi:hypothetical protein